MVDTKKCQWIDQIDCLSELLFSSTSHPTKCLIGLAIRLVCVKYESHFTKGMFVLKIEKKYSLKSSRVDRCRSTVYHDGAGLFEALLPFASNCYCNIVHNIVENYYASMYRRLWLCNITWAYLLCGAHVFIGQATAMFYIDLDMYGSVWNADSHNNAFPCCRVISNRLLLSILFLSKRNTCTSFSFVLSLSPFSFHERKTILFDKDQQQIIKRTNA